MASKEAFLKGIAHSLGRSEIKKEPPQHPDFQQGALEAYNTRLCKGNSLEQFEAACRVRGAKLTLCHQAEIGDKIQDKIHQYGGGEVTYAGGDQAKKYGLALLETEEASFHLWDLEKSPEENRAQAEKAKIGITFPLGAISETGMLIQPVSDDQARSISLLPEVHLSLVKASTLYQTLTEAFAVLPEDRPSQLLFIAGPSSTGDIENNIVIGVHGPMAEEIFLILDC